MSIFKAVVGAEDNVTQVSWSQERKCELGTYRMLPSRPRWLVRENSGARRRVQDYCVRHRLLVGSWQMDSLCGQQKLIFPNVFMALRLNNHKGYR